MSGVFISYRRDDTDGHAGRLHDVLSEFFDDVFMDVATIRPGADFVREIRQSVEKSDVVIALIGPRWLEHDSVTNRPRIHNELDFVRLELRTGLEAGKYIVPVLVGDARVPAPSDLPDDLKPVAQRNAHRIRHESFPADTQVLVNFLRDRVASAVSRAVVQCGTWHLLDSGQDLSEKEKLSIANDFMLFFGDPLLAFVRVASGRKMGLAFLSSGIYYRAGQREAHIPYDQLCRNEPVVVDENTIAIGEAKFDHPEPKQLLKLLNAISDNLQ